MASVDQLQKKLSGVLQRHHVAVAYLFGSVARENAGPHSDMDIAVLFQTPAPDTRANIKRDCALVTALEDVSGYNIDLIDLAEVTSPLLRHRAVRRGKLLYCADHPRRQELELNVLHEYEDTRHLRTTASRAMQKRIDAGIFGKPL